MVYRREFKFPRPRGTVIVGPVANRGAGRFFLESKIMRINRSDLLARLESMVPGLSPQDVIEQSSCLVFRDKYVYTFNDEIGVRARSPLGITGAVAAAPLLALLRKLPEDEVEISVSGGELLITGKHRRAGVRLEAEILLPIDAIETPRQWVPLPPEFPEAVGMVEQCAGRDEEKFFLTCVHITPKWLEACDELQATRYNLKTGFSGPTLVRRNSIRHVTTMGATEFCETPTWVHFRNPDRVVLSIRRFVEDYPDLSEILAVDGQPTDLPRGLADAVERADVFASENADADSVLIELRPGKLTLTADSASGWYSEPRRVTYAGESLAFCVVPKILAAIVRKHSSAIITPARLKVDGGKFSYVTCLSKPTTPSKERKHGKKESRPGGEKGDEKTRREKGDETSGGKSRRR